MEKGQMIAEWLQEMLGEDYEVRYDDCDSAMTRVYFKPLNRLTKEIRNDDLTSRINVYDYEASRMDRMEAIAKGLM